MAGIGLRRPATMAVNVYPRPGSEGSDEYRAAMRLKEVFERDWKVTPQVPDGRACIDIHVSPYVLADGCPVEQLDLFVAINCAIYFAKEAAIAAHHPEVTSMFIVLEVKGHPENRIRFYADGDADVIYGNKPPASATGQNRTQTIATIKFLETYLAKAHRGATVPWISRACWFTGVLSNQYPYGHLNLPHHLVFSDLTVADLVMRAKMGPGQVKRLGDGRERWQASDNIGMYQFLRRAWTVPVPPRPLDKTRIDAIGREVAALAQNGAQKGLIFRGYGGTGKTFALLANAVHRFNQRDRVLVLTFNLVLTWELRRMVSMMGPGNSLIPHQDAGAPCITVETLSSWVRQMAVELELVTPDVDLFPSANPNYYKDLCKQLLDFVSACNDRNDIRQNLKTAASYEWVFIDEAQDVPKHEKDLVIAVFGPDAFCVSDGLDQTFRAQAATDWRRGQDGAIISGVTTHQLNLCYRLKSNLCDFVNRFASAINLQGLRLSPAPQAAGGKVIIHYGPARDALRDSFPLASSSNNNNGNSPADILVCAESSLVQPVNIPEEYLTQRNHKSWNGTLPETELGHMGSEQVRIVLMDHCRGLEGWCVFLLGLDQFYEKRVAQLETELAANHPNDYRRIAEEAAKKFITIPLTRAMDTLVIQVESRQSYLGSILSGLQGDFIEHHSHKLP